jgi:hypothetical protein
MMLYTTLGTLSCYQTPPSPKSQERPNRRDNYESRGMSAIDLKYKLAEKEEKLEEYKARAAS